MKFKEKVENPSGFRVGLRVKLPFGGWWFGSRKKAEWVKGKVVKLGPVREDGKIHGIIIRCYSKKYGTIGLVSSLNEQCNNIYKVKQYDYYFNDFNSYRCNSYYN